MFLSSYNFSYSITLHHTISHYITLFSSISYNSLQNLSAMNPHEQDSLTLDHYFTISHNQTLGIKKKSISRQQGKKQRKNSTQLSIFTWLHQEKSTQQCLMVTVDKYLILKIFSYLRLSDVMVASQTCSYFRSCYRLLWTDNHYFQELSTDKLSGRELGEVIQKSSGLSHIRELKKIYQGKNISCCRQKIRIKASGGTAMSGKLLEVFTVAPKSNRGFAFILDSQLGQLISTSFVSLLTISLSHCTLITSFKPISRCLNLIHLSISHNDHFQGKDLKGIVEKCVKIEKLELEETRALGEDVWAIVAQLQALKVFALKGYRHGFASISKLEQCLELVQIDLQGSLINDMEALTLLRLKQVISISFRECPLLTNEFLLSAPLHLPKSKLKHLDLSKTNLHQGHIAEISHLLSIKL